MIFDLIIELIFTFIALILNFFPPITFFDDLLYLDWLAILAPLTIIFEIVPLDLWYLTIKVHGGMYTFRFGYGLVRWVYKKFPGVD